jgi:hypothetical protein
MQRIVRFEVETSASVGGLSVDFGVQCHFFLLTRTSKKGITLSDSISIVNWTEGLKTVEVAKEIL